MQEYFLEVLGVPLESEITTEVLKELTTDQVAKANSIMLSTFIKIRINTNLYDRYIIVTLKGNLL